MMLLSVIGSVSAMIAWVIEELTYLVSILSGRSAATLWWAAWTS